MEESNGTNQKGLIGGLVIVILVLTVALAYMLVVKKAEAPGPTEIPLPIEKTVPPVPPMALPTQTVPVATPAETASVADKNIYTNSQFGFQLTIPEGYPDWKAMIEKDYGGAGVTYIHLLFKTSDPQWKNMVEENFVTHEKYIGYASIFALTAWTKDAYAKAEKECKNNPTPDCPQTVIGSNSQYIFDASLGNGVPPKDLEKLRESLSPVKNIGKVLDFKALL